MEAGPARAGLRYFLPFVRPYRARLAGVFALTAFGAVLGLTYPFFLQNAIDRIFLPQDGVTPQMSQLRVIAAVVFTLSIVQLVVSAFGRYLHAWVATHLLFDMRSALYRHVMSLPVGFFTKTRVGEVQARLGADLAEVQSTATGALLQFVGSALALTGALGFLLYYSVRLTLIAFLFMPVALGLLLLFQRKIHSIAYQIRKDNTDITSDVIETFGAVKTIKAFTAEEHRLDGFRTLNRRMIGSILRFQVTSALAAGMPGTVLIAASAVIFLVGGSMVLNGAMTVGALIACNIYLMRLFGPIQGMIGLYIRLQRARAALDRVFEFLHAGPPESDGKGRTFATIERGIALQNLTFAYDSNAPLFRDVDVRVPASSMIAIVGRSGAGKTTLLDLMAGFALPSDGGIEFDGVPLSEYDVRSLRSKTGFVVQGGDLFSGTVEENIRFGRHDPSVDDLRRAVDIAGLASVIERLGGMGGRIGERGSGLSAGERARVAIARAVLGDPRLLLLDEALGRLDPEGREKVLQALLRATRGRTAFLVTHDQEVARAADSVLFVTGTGNVITGTHQDLESEHEAYRKLFRSVPVRKAVRVALIDSGVHRGHPHVKRVEGGVTVRWDEDRALPTVAHDGAPDTIGHGTACAGVIHEAAPEAEIMPVRVFETQLQTSSEVLAKAMREAVEFRPSIVHLSLGATSGNAIPEIKRLCGMAEAHGIVVVSTAVNGQESIPGCVDTVISVGSDPALGRQDVAAGPDAAGVDYVASPFPRDIPGAPRGANMSGPSFAAARVSGIIACILAEDPRQSPKDVRATLQVRFPKRNV